LRRRTRHIALSRNVQNVPVSSGGRRVQFDGSILLLRAPLSSAAGAPPEAPLATPGLPEYQAPRKRERTQFL
ncbi:unnamed protein product, partial [Ectocarpus sp. 13 AM-2016]